MSSIILRETVHDMSSLSIPSTMDVFVLCCVSCQKSNEQVTLEKLTKVQAKP